MAEDSDQERTEEPTGKRLDDAKKRGQIPRSKELGTLAVLMAGVIIIAVTGGNLMQGLWDVMEADLRLDRRDLFDPAAPLAHLGRDLTAAGRMLWPLFGVTVLAALLTPIALGGFNISFEAIAPKFEKLSPLKGLGRIVSVHAATELLKAVLKVLLVGGVASLLYLHYRDEILSLSRQPLLAASADSLHILKVCLIWLTVSLVLVAGLDAPFQVWSHKRKLRMTRQEVKDEMRDSEGRPEVKSRIRSLQMEMSRRRMMDEVPKADVVVTNPTHFAVALKYDQSKMGAPKVVAKGADMMAAQIRNLATGAGVPLLASPRLARALYFSTDLDREIPPGLYLAVAQVLAYIYQLRAARFHGGDIPAPLGEIEVPDEFVRDPPKR